jgi:tRNA(adenine34) deaminase
MTTTMMTHTTYMTEALRLAEFAATIGEVPVGAVVVKDGEIIGRGYNRREIEGQATRHAEIVAMEEASDALGAWRLSGCTLYVTLEPCLMCAGAIYQSRVDEVIFGAMDAKAGACGSLYRIHEDARLNHRFLVSHGVLESESREMLQKFFRRRRQRRDGRVAEGARLEI